MVKAFVVKDVTATKITVLCFPQNETISIKLPLVSLCSIIFCVKKNDILIQF